MLFRSDLRDVSGPRATTRRVELIDSERLPREFAGLFASVRTLSQGTRTTWRPLPGTPRRYAAPTVPSPARLRPLPAGFQRVTLTSGTTLVAFSAADGQLPAALAGRRGI